MASVPGPLPPSPPPTATLAEAAELAPTPADGDVPVCLDFLKGRCSRKRCRFLHPDLSQFQQLSGAVQAQAGRQVCEVWAMTGTCKFGPSCSRLHPVVLNQPAQTVMTLYLPVAVVPQPILMPSQSALPAVPAWAALPAPPQRRESAAMPTLLPLPPPPPPAPERLFLPSAVHPVAPVPHVPNVQPAATPYNPLIPQLVPSAVFPATPSLPIPGTAPAPGTGPSPPLPPAVAASKPPANVLHCPQHVLPESETHSQPSHSNAQTELQDLAQFILASMQAGRKDSRAVAPASKGEPDAAPQVERRRGRSLACLFGTDGADAVSEGRSFDQPSSTAPTPPPAPNPPRRWSHNPRHDRDRAFLDMLRDLHNAGAQFSG